MDTTFDCCHSPSERATLSKFCCIVQNVERHLHVCLPSSTSISKTPTRLELRAGFQDPRNGISPRRCLRKPLNRLSTSIGHRNFEFISSFIFNLAHKSFKPIAPDSIHCNRDVQKHQSLHPISRRKGKYSRSVLTPIATRRQPTPQHFCAVTKIDFLSGKETKGQTPPEANHLVCRPLLASFLA